MANDHFIPQFYLKNFEIPERPGWIYSYKRGRKPIPLAIRSVASATDFYTLKTPQVDVPQNAPDEFLKHLESAAAPIVKKLLTAARLELSHSEAMILSMFVGFLAARTPMARQKALNVHLAMRMRLLKDLAENREEYEKLVSKLNLAKTPKEAELARQGLLDPEKNLVMSFEGNVDDFSLQKSFKTGELLTEILLRKRWILVEARAEQKFVTSDNPFVALAPEPYVPGMDVDAISAECLFPISPRRALLFSNRIGGNSIYRVGKDRMSDWTWQIISFGFETVFASFSSGYVKQEFDKIPTGEITKVPISSLPPVLPLMES